jgi:hypothetical protein
VRWPTSVMFITWSTRRPEHSGGAAESAMRKGGGSDVGVAVDRGAAVVHADLPGERPAPPSPSSSAEERWPRLRPPPGAAGCPPGAPPPAPPPALPHRVAALVGLGLHADRVGRRSCQGTGSPSRPRSPTSSPSLTSSRNRGVDVPDVGPRSHYPAARSRKAVAWPFHRGSEWGSGFRCPLPDRPQEGVHQGVDEDVPVGVASPTGEGTARPPA